MFSDNDNEEFMQSFLEESFDMIETINEALDDLRNGGDFIQGLNSIFRGVHTIKGGSGMFSLTNMHDKAHELETFISNLQQRASSESEKMSKETLLYLQQNVDLIEALLKNGDSLEGLELADAPAQAVGQDQHPQKLVTHYFETFYDQFDELIETFIKDKTSQFEVLVPDFMLDKFKIVVEKVGAEVLSDENVEDQVALLISSSEKCLASLQSCFDKLSGKIKVHTIYTPVGKEDTEEHKEQTEMEGLKFSGAHLEKTDPSLPNQSASPVEKKSPSTQNEMLRIPLDKVNSVLDNIWEVFLIRNQLAYLVEQNRRELEKNHISFLQAFDSLDTTLKRNVAEIESKTMSMRMSNVKSVFQRMKKMVDSYSSKTGKVINFKTVGEHIELDKKVIDMLAEPLVHLVRNAMDHGIEAAQDRERASKPIEGAITLKASMSGNVACIEIEDDGKGINAQAVLASAKRKGLDTSHVKNDSDAINLIFMPGFSTAEVVSDVSGRGVGMDAVKSSVESLGGNVTVSTELGQGSIFKINLPLGMSVLSALVVRVNNFVYAINSDYVLRTKKVTIFDLKKNGNQEYFNFDDEFIPCIPLSNTFVSSEYASESHIKTDFSVCVISTASGLVAVRVDEILQSTGLVAKPLPKNGAFHPYVSSVSLLQSGRPVFILALDKMVKDLVVSSTTEKGHEQIGA